MAARPLDVGGAAEARPTRAAAVLSVAVPAFLVAGMLLLLIKARTGAESAVADLAGWLPVGYAFAAGMVASVNPCGFFLLPSYASYHLGADEGGAPQAGPVGRALKALFLGVAATLGFVAVFAAVGSVIAAGGHWLIDVFPYAGLAVGVAMGVLGAWLFFTRRTLGIPVGRRATLSQGRDFRNVFLFGIGYAVGSLSCTLPIFLVVVGSSLATRGLAGSFGQFIGYALGMGVVIILVTLGAALFKGAVARSLRMLLPHVHAVGALFLMGAGVYLVYYWVRFGDLF